MKKLVFAVAGYNFAETGRMIEIAREAREDFDVVFASYGGRYEPLIEGEGFDLLRLEPRLTSDRLARLRDILSGEAANTVGYLRRNDLEARVPNELDLFRDLDPAAVLTGWCLSVALSARAAGVPFVNVLHSTTIREYYEAGLQSWPDRSDFPFVRWLFGGDEARMRRWMSRLVLRLKLPVRPYNAVARAYHLPEFRSFIDLIEGDETLLADIPEWVGFDRVRPTVHFIGPLPFRLDAAVPPAVTSLPRDRPVVYFAMGSSGKPKLIADLLEAFGSRPWRVIAPVRPHVERMNLDVPNNVIVTDFLPAHRVNPMADVSVIHGGQNTVMNACLAGTPIVGIGMHPEQQANLDACARKGFAIRLSKRKTTSEAVLQAVDTILGDERAKAAVETFRDQLEAWDGPKNAAAFLRQRYGGPPAFRAR